jgi:hypothetical protein
MEVLEGLEGALKKVLLVKMDVVVRLVAMALMVVMVVVA